MTMIRSCLGNVDNTLDDKTPFRVYVDCLTTSAAKFFRNAHIHSKLNAAPKMRFKNTYAL